MNELLFQLLSRLGLEPPPNEGQNPIAAALRTDPYTPDDEPYLRQYLGVSKDGGLTPTNLRPRSLSINDKLPWYRPTNSPIDNIMTQSARPIGNNIPRTTAIAQGDVSAMKVGDILPLRTPTVPGLGHMTASVGKGHTGEPYLSVYDKWDFGSSPVIQPLVGALMERAGSGFHVYERYPLSKRPNGSYRVGGDIQLPSDK